MFKMKKDDSYLENALKQLNMYTMQVAMELETLKNINTKFDSLNERLSILERKIAGETEEKNNSSPLTVKNKTAIKLIIRRHEEITATELSKLLKLSRTRCNEYLVEMEKDGVLVSKIVGREKFYSLRK